MLDWDESRELFDTEVNVSEAGMPGSVSTEGRAGRVQHGGFGCLLVLPKPALPVAGPKEARIVTRALQSAQSFPSSTAQNLLLDAGAPDCCCLISLLLETPGKMILLLPYVVFKNFF